LHDVGRQILDVRNDVARLETRMLRRFDEVDARFDTLETRMTRLEERIA
jgi:flagellar capping protein FliD